MTASMYAFPMATLSQEAKRGALAGSPLFAELPETQIGELTTAAGVRTLARGEQLFHKGDEGSRLFAVVRGRLKALTTSREGDDVVFSILGPGEVIGEIALLGGTRRTATVTAIEPCELLVIDRRDLVSFLKRHPDVAIRMMQVLAARLAQLSDWVEDALFLNLPLRLAKRLLALADLYGEETPDGLRVDLKLSQEEWGDLVGATRESVNKQIRAWTREGLVSVDRGYVVIHRRDEFEALADGG
jgi:CRP/FNR family cyclic AMP-dependent transcriptional regulator